MTRSSSDSNFSVSTVVIAAIAWGALSLLFFLLFSVSPGTVERPLWYSVVTYLLEEVAFLGAAVLCFRNWRSSQIVSGRGVWLAFALGMISYFVGNLIFGIWELVWQQDPTVSPADIFFIATYVCLAWGMVQAVLPRRLSLELYQWGIVLAVIICSVAIAGLLWFSPGASEEDVSAPPPALEQPADPVPASSAPTDPAVTPSAVAPALETPAVPEPEVANAAPGWVIALDEALVPLSDVVGLLYILGDVALLASASTLLLAFWGGRFSQSWRMIAAASFCFYLADLWFLYAGEQENYQSGSLPEVFWIFSGVLFAIGASLEYGVSTRSRRGRRRA